MAPPNRRRAAQPDSQALQDLTAPPTPTGRIRKAPVSDPVLGAGTATPAAVDPDEQQVAAATKARRAPAVTAGKEKVGFYQLPDDSARARAAFTWTRNQEGHRSFSDFISAAVMREVERVERKYNNGESWPAMEAGEIPTGKPFGS